MFNRTSYAAFSGCTLALTFAPKIAQHLAHETVAEPKAVVPQLGDERSGGGNKPTVLPCRQHAQHAGDGNAQLLGGPPPGGFVDEQQVSVQFQSELDGFRLSRIEPLGREAGPAGSRHRVSRQPSGRGH